MNCIYGNVKNDHRITRLKVEGDVDLMSVNLTNQTINGMLW